MRESSRNAVSLVLTAIVAMCALVVTGLVGMTVFGRRSADGTVSRLAIMTDRTRYPGTLHRLPPLPPPYAGAGDALRLALPEHIRGLPTVPEAASVVRIGDSPMLFLPVLMVERELPIQVKAGVVDPLRWAEADPFSRTVVGRRSLWFMDIGATMLYGVLMDPRSETASVGVGFVVVKRLNEDTYDVVLEDHRGGVLFAARGQLVRLNPSIGLGTLRPTDDQSAVRRDYGPLWTAVAPEHFPLFSAGLPGRGVSMEDG